VALLFTGGTCQVQCCNVPAVTRTSNNLKIAGRHNHKLQRRRVCSLADCCPFACQSVISCRAVTLLPIAVVCNLFCCLSYLTLVLGCVCCSRVLHLLSPDSPLTRQPLSSFLSDIVSKAL
jgi:hypothetical protein